MLNKLDAATDGKSKDIVAANVAKLRQLFPDVFTEGKINFDALKDALGEYVEDRDERYSFTWHGKGRARRLAQTPSAGTLRPCPEESLHWDGTQNLFIEGDNLEVLKLLQKSYHKRVKMIYIDPPYNTGREFIYPDDFSDNIGSYLRYTGQVDGEGRKMTANLETSGRYHTNWLNMMYPRLRLARNLLRPDGVIFISIDDNEVANLRKLCDEVFGEENFVATLTWETKRAARGVPPRTLLMENHEYIVAYSGGGDVRFRGLDRSEEDFANPDGDPRGLWRSESMKATGSQNNWFTIVDPATGNEFYANWAFSESTLLQMIEDDLVIFPKDPTGTPRQKKFIDSYTNETKAFVTSLGWYSTERATTEFMNLFDGKKVFDFPKPVGLLQFLCEQTLKPGDIVLDFFAGSGTTAHAVFNLNNEGNGNVRFIMVQLPEPTEEKSAAYKAGFRTIADIGKERLRRVVRRLEAERNEVGEGRTPGMAGAGEFGALELGAGECVDLGFKVFKLDTSNMKPWDPDLDKLEDALFGAVDVMKDDRSDVDVLYELLLKRGLDLAVPMEERIVEGQKVFVVGGGALVVCLGDDIGLPVVEGIGALKDELKPEVMQVIFKDAGFLDDVVKTNAVQILQRAGVDKVVSV